MKEKKTKKILEATAANGWKRLQLLTEGGMILIVKEKYGDRYFDASTPTVLGLAAIKIVKGRLDTGWYFEDDGSSKEHWQMLQEAVKDAGNPGLAWTILRMRVDYEYEDYELEFLEKA